MDIIAEGEELLPFFIVVLPLSLMVKIWIFNAFSSTANGDSSLGRYYKVKVHHTPNANMASNGRY